jgi:hypothetical protein
MSKRLGIGSQGARSIYITPSAGEQPSIAGVNNLLVALIEEVEGKTKGIGENIAQISKEVDMVSHLVSAFQRGSVEEAEFIKEKLEAIEETINVRLSQMNFHLNERLDVIESKTFIGTLSRAWKRVCGS